MVKDITSLESELTQTKQERDTKAQEWTTLNNKYQQLLQTNPNAVPLTDEEIVAKAKSLGMKTQEEYQALKETKHNPKDNSAPESGVSPWWLLLIPVLLIGWGVIKGKIKS